MVKKILLSIISFVIWVLITQTFYLPSIILGIAVSVLVGFWFWDIFTEDPKIFFSPKRILRFLLYIPKFLWYCILSNLDVAYRVLHPKMPIKPGIVKVKTDLKTNLARTALANSITLTPGTFSLNITEDGYLYIHWIYVRDTELEKVTEDIVKKFEKNLKEVFE